MVKIFDFLFFVTSFALCGMGQVLIWGLPNKDRLVPYLLSAIFLMLVVIYLKVSKCQN